MLKQAHLTLDGFKTIIEIVYSYPNKRSQSKEFWNEVIESWFKSQAAGNKSGVLLCCVVCTEERKINNIQVVYGRVQLSGKILGWKCVFHSNSNLKSRQFGFTNDTESRVAIEQAIKYRDFTIKTWVDSLK